MRAGIGLALCLFCFMQGRGQQYHAAQIFAHNDYARAIPFYTAYDLQVGYIEADVFLRDGDLAVAHHVQEIEGGRNLERLYLRPLAGQVRKNNGFAYKDSLAHLTLMIDLKTEGIPTLNAVVKQLAKFPELIACKTLHFMISGSVPDPSLWKNYPAHIFFDGRPGIDYTPAQYNRISMISTSFGQHIQWDGHGAPPDEVIRKTRALMDLAHARGKKFRFWGTPDFENAWRHFMDLDMDVIVTDDVTALSAFLEKY